MNRLQQLIATPVGRGAVLLTLAAASSGFAMSAQGNVVANYFEHELGLTGPEFGYITGIREIPGFLLIFITALFYRWTLPRLTAGALALLAVGYALFGLSWSLWSVAPWVVISSVGYHTWLQTQYALGMSLTVEGRSGTILGRLTAIANVGTLLAMLVVLVGFQYELLSFRSTFVLCGAMALLAAVAVFWFPNLQDGQVQAVVMQRKPIVLRRAYRFYYLLSLLDGGRQQIFFSFGLWVLVHHYGLDVPMISAVLLAVTAVSVVTGPRIGRMVDKHGEKRMLAMANVGYVIALTGYALIDNLAVALACYVVFSFIFPFSPMGAAIYLRKIAPADEVAPSLAMGITMQHAAAIVVPIATGYVLNYVGFQIPFLVASGFAVLTFFATRVLSPETQKSEARLDEERRTALATAG